MVLDRPTRGKRRVAAPAAGPIGPVRYPTTDGKPLGETDWHLRAIFAAFGMIDFLLNHRPDVAVHSNLLVYYVEGNPRRFVVPDVFVANAPKRGRPIYKIWEEGAPTFVLEVASSATWSKDLGPKMRLYAELGVSEYFLFDPRLEYLPTQLMGFRLIDGEYRSAHLRADGVLPSEPTGLEFSADGERLRVYSAERQQWGVATEELFEHRVAELQDENARLRAELERFRSQLPP